MKRLLNILLLSCMSVYAFAQNVQPEKLETDLLSSFSKIRYWSDYNGVDAKIHRDDSILKANERFKTKLKYYAQRFPGTLRQQFPRLIKAGLTIATSKDSLFRIYSWDTETGGTMRFFDDIVQYKSNDKIHITTLKNNVEGNTGYYYSHLYTFKYADQVCYLAVYKGIYSSKDVGQGIQFYAISNGRLNTNLNLIKTSSGLKNKLYYSYDFFSVVDWKERPCIEFDEKDNVIKIPLIMEDGRATRKFITYKFTGKYFEKIKANK